MSHGQVGILNLDWWPSLRWYLDKSTGGCGISSTLTSI